MPMPMLMPIPMPIPMLLLPLCLPPVRFLGNKPSEGGAARTHNDVSRSYGDSGDLEFPLALPHDTKLAGVTLRTKDRA